MISFYFCWKHKIINMKDCNTQNNTAFMFAKSYIMSLKTTALENSHWMRNTARSVSLSSNNKWLKIAWHFLVFFRRSRWMHRRCLPAQMPQHCWQLQMLLLAWLRTECDHRAVLWYVKESLILMPFRSDLNSCKNHRVFELLCREETATLLSWPRLLGC